VPAWYTREVKKLIKEHQLILFSILAMVIVLLAVIIQLLKPFNSFALWVFNFVNDWVPALSATAAISLIVTFL